MATQIQLPKLHAQELALIFEWNLFATPFYEAGASITEVGDILNRYANLHRMNEIVKDECVRTLAEKYGMS